MYSYPYGRQDLPERNKLVVCASLNSVFHCVCVSMFVCLCLCEGHCIAPILR